MRIDYEDNPSEESGSIVVVHQESELLKEMHIYAFPSIWVETSCISAIEAMGAGCEIVTTNLGALYETCTPFGKLVGFDRNLDNLEKKL